MELLLRIENLLAKIGGMVYRRLDRISYSALGAVTVLMTIGIVILAVL
jgi:hypothetical protein